LPISRFDVQAEFAKTFDDSIGDVIEFNVAGRERTNALLQFFPNDRRQQLSITAPKIVSASQNEGFPGMPFRNPLGETG
jgi:hypothetical protein